MRTSFCDLTYPRALANRRGFSPHSQAIELKTEHHAPLWPPF
jgi:hypothetical protein